MEEAGAACRGAMQGMTPLLRTVQPELRRMAEELRVGRGGAVHAVQYSALSTR